MVRPAIEVRGLSKRYGPVVALDDIDLALDEHRVHGVLGRNGAGKTTLLQIITGQARGTAGRVRVLGRDPFEDEPVRSQVCFVSETLRYPDMLRVCHVLRAGRLLFPRWDDDYARTLVDEFDLPTGRRLKKLSRGMRSAVGVILGLASRAPLTCFDEPYVGLDAVARQLFYDRLLADYAEHPRTIVLSTHLIDEVADLIEHVVVIDRGRVVLDEEADALRGRAVAVTGSARVVERFVAGRPALHREDVGGFARVTLDASLGDAERAEAGAAGLAVEELSLQQLVIRATTHQGHGDGNEHVHQAVGAGPRRGEGDR